MTFIKWKDEDTWPSCQDFEPCIGDQHAPWKAGENEVQILVHRERCGRRTGIVCVHAWDCKNFQPFECMISKKGWEKYQSNQKEKAAVRF